MRQASITITVDIPAPLHRKLKKQATARRCSVRDLLLAGLRASLLPNHRPRPKRVRFPLIVSNGPKVDLSCEQIYEDLEFP